MQKPERVPHFPAIDGLRAIAVLSVIAFHLSYLTPIYGDPKLYKIMTTFTGAGWSGVDIFLVISGFFATLYLLNSYGEKRALPNYYIRRFLRIVPLCYAYFTLRFVIVPLLFHIQTPEFQEAAAKQAWYWFFLNNNLVAQKNAHYETGLSHFWYIALLVQFLVLWPLVVLLFKRKYLPWFCVVCIMCAFGLRLFILETSSHILSVSVLLPCRMDALSIGAVIACFYLDRELFNTIKPWVKWILLLCLILFCGLFILVRRLSLDSWEMLSVGLSWSSLLWGCCLMFAISLPVENLYTKVLSSRLLRFISKYSYGMYILHLPIISVLKRGLVFVPKSITVSPVGQLLVAVGFGLVCLFATITAAFFSWHLFEKHFVGLRKRFA
jgi:peptidoglycan/LPS O-acetylase OafA/YrhL